MDERMHTTRPVIRCIIQITIIILFVICILPQGVSASESRTSPAGESASEGTNEPSRENHDSSGYSESEDRIYSVLRRHGYSHEGACGILGNVAVENPQFEPDLEANHGFTYGLFQWTDEGDRRSNLVTFCNNRSIYHNRLDAQLAFALYELEGGDPIAKRCNEFMLNADDAGMAAMEFAVGFERCIGETSNPQKDGIYTGNIYPEFYGLTYQALTERINRAKEYEVGYRDFNGYYDKGILLENEADESLIRTPLKVCLFGALSVIIGYIVGCFFYNKIFKNYGQLSNFVSVRRLLAGRDEATESAVLDVLLGILFDIIKTYLAILICYLIFGKILRAEVIALAGLGVLLGNDFPVWNKGRGGYGTAITLLILTTYLPIWGLLCLVVGVVLIRLSGSPHIGIIGCCIAAIPFAFVTKGVPGGILMTLITLVSAGRRVMKYLYKRKKEKS